MQLHQKESQSRGYNFCDFIAISSRNYSCRVSVLYSKRMKRFTVLNLVIKKEKINLRDSIQQHQFEIG